MTNDLRNLNIPSYTVSSLLKRLSDLVRLSKAGFNLQIPEIRLGTEQGQTFKGYLVSVEEGSITIAQDTGNDQKPTVYVLGTDNIANISYEFDEQNNKLLDPSKPLPYKLDMKPLDVARLMKQYSEEVTNKIDHEVQFENLVKIGDSSIPHLCNSLNLVKQSILEIAEDDLGKESIKESISKIVLNDAKGIHFKLEDKTLLFNVHATEKNILPSKYDTCSTISRLL